VTRCVVITDGEQRSALALTRSLGRTGHRVIVCASRRSSIAGASRYAADRVVVPSSLGEPIEFADAIGDAVARFSADILIPVSEAALLAILPRRDALRPCIVPFAAAEKFVDICDKSLVLAAAVRHGIAVPRQQVLRSNSDLARLKGDLQFPVVVKPARSVANTGPTRLKSGAAHARDQSTLDGVVGRIPSEAYPVLVQQRVMGAGIGVFILLWDGEVRAAFAHRRIREKPPSGGVSVLSESVALDPDLLARSVALLRDFDWQGVAMVEYKLDEKTGEPYLMEVNGRFWGSLQLAIDAGVDFPNLLVAAACGDPTPPVGDYKIGVRLRWEWGDVDNLAMRFRRSPAALALPQGTPGRLRGAVDFARAFGLGTRGEVLRLDDPRPFLHETLNWFRGR
jgi:predicted ATP-grasp superfamily ATP-dependent carboligase